jgi:hypothetical protein
LKPARVVGDLEFKDILRNGLAHLNAYLGPRLVTTAP